ncbi:MAG: serine/threonine-protein kinase [Myxococcota bacterium]
MGSNRAGRGLGPPSNRSDVETRPIGGSDSDNPLPPGALGHAQEPWPGIGGNLGRYLVIDECGRGGMGVVLRAYDPKLQREVALKILWGDRADDDAQARIIREARALAQLSHPHVVSVYDVDLEETQGRTVVAMEYVPGTTLRKWLQEEPSTAEIIEAFVQAGRGLEAAHEVGLLHRDFKPSNVLRTEQGRLKVTDFGLAKWVEGAPSVSRSSVSSAAMPIGDDDEPLTRGDVVVGTPRYMAPEQLMGEPQTPAVDQYAFCIALWEALAGRPPFPTGNHQTMLSAKVYGPPPWPDSTPAPPGLVDALLRGLAPKPDERWPSMTALLDALDSDPQGKPGRWWMVAGATAVTAAAIAWGMAQSPPDERCTGARARIDEAWPAPRRAQVDEAFTATELPYAADSLERTLEALDDYADAWAEQHTRACEATTVRGEQSSAILDLRMACLEQRWRSLDATTRELASADRLAVENVDALLDSLPHLDPCSDVDSLLRDVVPPEPGQADEIERIERALAPALARHRSGHYEEAVEILEPLEAAAARLGYGPLLARLQYHLGDAQVRAGRAQRGREILSEGLASALAARRWAQARDTALQLTHVVGGDLAKTDEGRVYADVVRGLLAAAPDLRSEVELRRTLAMMARTDGRLEETERLLRDNLEQLQDDAGPSFDARASLLSDLANVLQDRGDYAGAEQTYREALALQRQLRGDQHPSVARAHANLGRALEHRGRYEESEREIRRALSISVAILGERHTDLITIRTNLGNALYVQNELEEAEAEHRKSLSIAQENYEPTHPRVAFARNNLALVLIPLDRAEEARQELRTAIDAWMSTNEPGHPYVAALHYNLGLAWTEDEHHAEAEAEYRIALEVGERALGADHPRLLTVRADLADALLAQERNLDEARTLAESAWATAETTELTDEDRGKIAWVVAQLRARDTTEFSEALELARTARDAFERAGAPYASTRETIDAWMAERQPQ